MADDTHILLRAFCDELARCGMRHACTSPGSRNAPLLLALAREPRLRCWSHIDERSGGFFALGLARATDSPVAIAVTSGTAAAELSPAVHEAFQARVPLLVLTADRPPELREIGAGQTIDQIKLYGTAAKWFFEVGTHEATPERLRWMRQLACRAYWTTIEGRPGPVHLNFPFREPLVPEGELPVDDSGRAALPWVQRLSQNPGPVGMDVERPLIVAGRTDQTTSEWLSKLAAVGLVVLADPLSGARRQGAIAHYDAFLRTPPPESFRPELILRVGDLPTSKPLRAWLAAAQVEQIVVDPHGTWPDPDSVATARAGLPIQPQREPDPDLAAVWRQADTQAATAIAETLGDELSEPLVAADLGARLPPGATLVAASSMPVRDVETFFPARDDPPRVISNRGANGIDGTISTLFGVAAAEQGPAVGLIGDVAFLHDVGGLMAAVRLGLKATIVLLNNDGGGIFHFLPVAGQTEVFEEHVATPHGMDFARLAAAYGCEHRLPQSRAEFHAALDEALSADAATIIEIRTDRAANLELHRRCWDAVAEALATQPRTV